MLQIIFAFLTEWKNAPKLRAQRLADRLRATLMLDRC